MKEIPCETYSQRIKYLGHDGHIFDMILSMNGIYVPAQLVKTMMTEWELYKKEGDFDLDMAVTIQQESYESHKRELGDIRSAIIPEEYDMQSQREALDKWIARGKEWEEKEKEYKEIIRELKEEKK